MKILVMIAAVIMSTLISANAQEQRELPPAEKRADMQTEMLQELLELTKEQNLQVNKITLQAAKGIDDVIQLNDRMEKLKTLRKVMGEKDEALKEVLTKVQYKLYVKSKDEMKKKIRNKIKE